MTVSMAIAFAVAMFSQAAVPGPSVFTTLARSLSGGIGMGAAVVCGIIVGDIAYAMLAVFALSAVANSLGEFFFIVKILGGLYLIWLGVRQFMKTHQATAHSAAPRQSLAGGFSTGIVTTLANPKAILFYGGFLPAFFDLSAFDLCDTLKLIWIIIAVLAVVLMLYVLLASAARGLFQSKKGMSRLQRMAGTVMVMTGLIVISRS